ncbi:MAG TPA: PAC2 family protein [Dehalococcoidales bacterium]|nr:PAC2 family protein [Dehalococcoidales bacterium]
MGIVLNQEPELNNPDMIVGWPGIGNVGIITVETMRQALQAEELGEIEPWDFFYPNKVVIQAGILTDMSFPGSKFYFKRTPKKDLLFFIGEEQPATRESAYAEGKRAYEMANMVLDVAQKFSCRRVYTSGAAIAITHHTMLPKVWAVANQKLLLSELRSYDNTILMSEVEGKGNQGSITGLNGLLIGAAKRRGMEGICLMGEIPDYLSRMPFPYPKASKAVLGTLARIMGVTIAHNPLEDMIIQMDTVVENVYQQFPPEIKERLEQRKVATQNKQEAISEEDEQWFKEHIDEFFNKDKGA